MPTVQSELGSIKDIKAADVCAIKKAEGSRTSQDAYTSMKGVSNMWLTGIYGGDIRRAYGRALRDLFAHDKEIGRILVFDSDITHLSPLTVYQFQFQQQTANIHRPY